MKLTVDCVLTHQLATLQANSALARLLGAAQLTISETPLEALICHQYGLVANPDLPIAPIAAAADGLAVDAAYWLRADPVNLVMQRDCFVLADPVPLSLEPAQASQILNGLNQHFIQDGLQFHIGKSGAWYVQSQQIPKIQTALPSIVVGKNVHQFLPQGADAPKWRSILNEVQMLLHEHPVNHLRESLGQVAVNSVWFSGGGIMPTQSQYALASDATVIMAEQILYQGLAQFTDTHLQTIPNDFDELVLHAASHSHVRLQLPLVENLDATWFEALLLALQHQKISQLTLNLGCYEKCVIVKLKPSDIYLQACKFWRKSKPVAHYLP